MDNNSKQGAKQGAKQEMINTFIENYGDRLGDSNFLRLTLNNMTLGKCAATIADYANKLDLEDSDKELNESREWVNGRW